MFSKMQSIHISKGKTLTLGSRSSFNWHFFELISETSLVFMISVSFIFCERVNQKETKYSESEAEVRLKTMFSLKTS